MNPEKYLANTAVRGNSYATHTSAADCNAVPGNSTPAVLEHRERLNEQIHRNHELIGHLYSRLECVLTPVPPMDAATISKPEAMVCGLACDLRAMTDRLNQNNDLIGGLLKRLEV